MNKSPELSKQPDLIYDIGMHRGEDTDFYLRKGFRVVGIEADPDLVEHCRSRFAQAIADGRLSIVPGAIIEPQAIDAGQRSVRFFRSEVSVWGTACPDWAARNERLGQASSRQIEVPVANLVDIVARFGVPYYMKIDIEGQDMACVRALSRWTERPDYVSIESDKCRFGRIRAEIDTLVCLGYDAFQAVEQSAVVDQQPPRPPREGADVPYRFEHGASGLFGRELPGPWRSRRQVLSQYRAIRLGYLLLGDDGLLNRWRFRGANSLRAALARLIRLKTGNQVPGWYDTHARHQSATTR